LQRITGSIPLLSLISVPTGFRAVMEFALEMEAGPAPAVSQS